jgi:hypothetical protein
MTDAPNLIPLGTVTIEAGAMPFFSIPATASPAEITKALEKLEADRVAAEIAETERLRELFPLVEDAKADEAPGEESERQ